MTQRSRGFIIQDNGTMIPWNSICKEDSQVPAGYDPRIEVIVPQKFSSRLTQLMSYQRHPSLNTNSGTYDSVSIRNFISIGEMDHKRTSSKRDLEKRTVDINKWKDSTKKKTLYL
eukprot:scaffold1091_cov164-Ochromonas_danica.AAC.33